MLLFPALATLLCMAAGERLEKRQPAFRLIWLIPFLCVLLLTGGRCLIGLMDWIDVILVRWNQVREAGIRLLDNGMTEEGLRSFSFLMAVLQAELIWFFLHRSRNGALGLYNLGWMLLLLLLDDFPSFSCALFLAGLLGSVMAGANREISLRMRCWMLGMAGVLCIGARLVPAGELPGIRLGREAAAEAVHTLRYGEKLLPEGDLREADKLKSASKIVMGIQSEQEKSLYLKGFVGARLLEGTWRALPDAAYGGEDAGILQWLSEQGFDPLTQSAGYYELCENAEKPEKNTILIRMEKGNRYYLYAPSSLAGIDMGEGSAKKDLYLKSQGLLGQRQYKETELSSARPAELTIPEAWVTAPVTVEQQAYSEAEAVYRDFVYRHYTTVDADLDGLLQSWFWADYETESDGIYSAVSHIREKLAEGITYTETPEAAPEGTEPIRWFLTESREGNAMLYASAAVEALRSHGIPARYVEGYYLSAGSFSESHDGSAIVSGENAHAWAEVYFDGIGWLPVDVTPGYYYDALRLQQMVGLPDAVRKTAALEESDQGADEIQDLENGAAGGESESDRAVPAAGKQLLGFLAIVLLLLTAGICTAELLRGLRLRRLVRSFQQEDIIGRARTAEWLLFALLGLLGIDASLGWAADKVDRELSERFEAIRPGEYRRVSRLLEKAVYAETLLEPYEERTIYSFFDKLAAAGRKQGLLARLRIRYMLF